MLRKKILAASLLLRRRRGALPLDALRPRRRPRLFGEKPRRLRYDGEAAGGAVRLDDERRRRRRGLSNVRGDAVAGRRHQLERVAGRHARAVVARLRHVRCHRAPGVAALEAVVDRGANGRLRAAIGSARSNFTLVMLGFNLSPAPSTKGDEFFLSYHRSLRVSKSSLSNAANTNY